MAVSPYAETRTAGRRARRPARGRLIPLDELEPAHLASWKALAERAAEPNPFFEPEFVLPVARHVGESRAALMVVEGPEREWLACMPVVRSVHAGHMRVPVVSSRYEVYAALRTPLVDGSAVEPAVAALIDTTLRSSRVGIVALPWVGADGPVAAALLATLASRGRRPALERSFERAVMRRPTLDDGVDALLTRGHRRDLARLARRLGEELGAPLEVRDESERASAVDGFLAVEASGWKGERGTALASRAGHDEFFRGVCDGFRAAGRLQMLTLGTNERTVSYKCNLLCDDAVFCFKIAYDEAFAHYRPGLQLELRMLEWFRDQMQQSWMDSCADAKSPLFEHLWPERRRISSYAITTRRVTGWAVRRSASLLARKTAR